MRMRIRMRMRTNGIPALEADTESFVQFVISSLPASTGKLEQIKSCYQGDVVCSNLIQFCRTGWPEKSALSESLKGYWSHQGEIAFHNGLLLRGSRLIIPHSLQAEMLDKVHEGHQGIAKCRQRAKQSIWWLGISKELEQKVKSCEKCLIGQNDQAEPLLSHEFPKRPWQRLATDLFELKGQMYLLVVDYYSRYIELAKLSGTSAKTVINHMKSIFARHGIPEILVSDGGTCYTAREFAEFAASYGFKHITSNPKLSQSNGLAERSVQTVKHFLKKSEDPYLALLAYRSTPLHNGNSPAELLMSRQLMTPIPTHPKNLTPKLPNRNAVQCKERAYKQKQRENYMFH